MIGDHALRLTFEDGTVGDAAFEDREWFGVFEPLRDPVAFAPVYVDEQFGTIAWPGGLDMARTALRSRAPAPSVNCTLRRLPPAVAPTGHGPRVAGRWFTPRPTSSRS